MWCYSPLYTIALDNRFLSFLKEYFHSLWLTSPSRHRTWLTSKRWFAEKTLSRILLKLHDKVLYPLLVPSETNLLFPATAETTERKQPEKSSGGVGAFFCTCMVNLEPTEELEILYCIKFRSKLSSNTILCLLQNLMHQTLDSQYPSFL